jgi:hypothetical protein
LNDELSTAKQRKTNSQIGALLLVCGLLALMFGLFATFIATMQFLMLQLIPAPTTAQERHVLYVMWRMISTFLMFMPTMALLGGLLLASGWQVRRGRATAIRMARWTLLGAIGFGVVYFANIAAMLFDPQMGRQMLELPPLLAPYRTVVYVVQGVFAMGMQFGPPVLLLLLLSRVRPVIDDSSISATPGK